MTKLKLGLSRRNPENLVALAKTVHANVAPEEPNVPPVAGVEAEAAALLAASNTCEAKNQAYEDAKTALEAAGIERETAADALRLAHDVLAGVLEAKSKGNPAQLALTGYDLSGPSNPATEPPAKAGNLVVTAGDNDGTLDAACDPVPLTHSYQWETTTGDAVTGPWTAANPTTVSSITLTGLTSGTRVWVRVRAIGAKGPGPWSSPVSKIVP